MFFSCLSDRGNVWMENDVISNFVLFNYLLTLWSFWKDYFSRKIYLIWNSDFHGRLIILWSFDSNQDRKPPTLPWWDGKSFFVQLHSQNKTSNSSKSTPVFSWHQSEKYSWKYPEKIKCHPSCQWSWQYTLGTNIFEKSCLQLINQPATKTALANFHVWLFSCLRVSVTGDVSHRSSHLFQASWYRQFLLKLHNGCTTETVGRWIVVNHNTLRLCKRSLNFSQCHFCIYQSAKRNGKEREKLVYVYMVYYQLRGLYTIFGVWRWWFFQSRLNVKNTRAIFLLISMFTYLWKNMLLYQKKSF